MNERDDLQFMKEPLAWPLWPVLCLKKRSKILGKWPEAFGVLLHGLSEKVPQPIVYDFFPHMRQAVPSIGVHCPHATSTCQTIGTHEGF